MRYACELMLYEKTQRPNRLYCCCAFCYNIYTNNQMHPLLSLIQATLPAEFFLPLHVIIQTIIKHVVSTDVKYVCLIRFCQLNSFQ